MKPFVLALFVGLHFFSIAAASQPIDSAAIDRTVQEAMRYWQVPGVAVAIVRDDAVIYLKGFGVKEIGKKDPVTPDTLFPLASCTKAFTTMAMAILVDEGKMGWDDPVRRHVDFFHLSDPSADALVTLRDLVSHRTGVGSHELLWYRSPWSQEEIIRRIGKVKLDYPFRSTFHYQTTMFTTAGCLISCKNKY
jgi:CubicO group peptidase (beta-lactamase class C family)